MPAEFELLLRARYPLIWLDSPEEARIVEIAARVGRGLGDAVAAWSQTWGLYDVPGEPRPGAHSDPLKLLEHIRKQGRRAIWLLLDFAPLLQGNPALARALRDTAHSCRSQGGVLVCVAHGGALPEALSGEAALHQLALPTAQDHEQLLRRVARELQLPLAAADVQALSFACLGLTLDQAENIWARVRAAGGRFTERDLGAAQAEKARIVKSSGYLELVHTCGLDDVGGLGGLKGWVQRRQLAFSPEARAIGLPWPRGALLVGVQGCGKSLIARAIAGHWHQPLVRMDVGSLMEGLVGASERNLRGALGLAERIAPCVLWVDEIEKAFSGLSAGTDGGTIMRMFGTMLTWMQEKTSPVFLLATANEIESLPPEMMRKGRFDEIFFVDLPGEVERREIFRVHLSARGRAASDPGLLDRIDLDSLVSLSLGYSGAEIAASVVEGAFSALASGQPLSEADVGLALAASPPLSRTRAEPINRLRDWARGRARLASQEEPCR